MVKCIVAGEMPQMKLQCVSMPDKGRGMVSSCVISPGSLVHSEEPYAMVTNNYILCIIINYKFIFKSNFSDVNGVIFLG